MISACSFAYENKETGETLSIVMNNDNASVVAVDNEGVITIKALSISDLIDSITTKVDKPTTTTFEGVYCSSKNFRKNLKEMLKGKDCGCRWM